MSRCFPFIRPMNINTRQVSINYGDGACNNAATITLPDGTVVTRDDGPRPGTNYEGVSQLKPVFRPDGTVTAGNACPLNDGAAAVLVMSDTKAKRLGLTPLARIVSTTIGLDAFPRMFEELRTPGEHCKVLVKPWL